MVDVIVIGAGAAGIAAASECMRRGASVVVVEARDRIGGRIHTARVGGNAVDLGASWIHGHKHNPLMRLAKKYNVPIVRSDYEAVGLYRSSGERASEEVAREAVELSGWLYDWAEKLCHRHPKRAPDMSLAAAMGQDLDRRGGGWVGRLREPRALDWSLGMLGLMEGIDSGQLSVRYFEDDDPFGGEDYLFREGYESLFRPLYEELDVRLEHVVERVEHGAHGVKVWIRGGEMIEGEHVIVTLPLGVLKRKEVVFDPPLSSEKTEAIEGLGMGVLDKIVLLFDQVFWDREDHVIGKLDPPYGAVAHMTSLVPVTGAPVLIGYWAGDDARAIEARSDEQLVAQAMDELRVCFGDRVREPVEALVTRWDSDAFARGSYSYIPVGGSGLYYDVMSEPVGSRVFFAGEATERDHPATVHGALLSGLREARRVMGGEA